MEFARILAEGASRNLSIRMRHTPFTVAPKAVGFAVVLALGSMARYPGGTALNHSSQGYSLSGNFLSDLGMTVAYGGQRNILGALLFVLSLGTLVVGLGNCLFGLVRLCAQEPRARPVAYLAAAIGLLVCLAFAGVALTPENRVMTLHVFATLVAFRLFPAVALLMGIASLYSSGFSTRMPIAWGVLTGILLAYVAVLEWGPRLGTPHGLVVQVIAQKVVAVLAVGILVFLSLQAAHVMTSAAGQTGVQDSG